MSVALIESGASECIRMTFPSGSDHSTSAGAGGFARYALRSRVQRLRDRLEQ